MKSAGNRKYEPFCGNSSEVAQAILKIGVISFTQRGICQLFLLLGLVGLMNLMDGLCVVVCVCVCVSLPPPSLTDYNMFVRWLCCRSGAV